MGTLGNPSHERFCQDVHRRIWAGEKRTEAITAAYRHAIFNADDPRAEGGSSIVDNARRLVNRTLIKARLDELAENAAKLANLDAGWALLRAKRIAEFDANDFLRGNGDLSDLPGDVEIVGRENDPSARVLFKTKIKASDRLTALAFMAKIAGWLAPEKQELTTQVTLEQLVNDSLKPKEIAM